MGRPIQDMDDDEDDLGALYDETGNERDNRRPAAGHNRGLDEPDALDDMDLDDVLKEGRKVLLADLVKAVRDGMATPAEKNTLRQMLKDNGMVMGDPNTGAEGGQRDRPKATLPTFDKPDYA